MIKKILTIAGSDCSGGAGIQADIKTITVHKMYAMSVITSVTAQNTMGVTDIVNLSPDFVGKQLDCIFTDIYPDSIKIGMVSTDEIIESIVQKLTFYNAKNIVLDPVMISTSGSKLMSDKALTRLVSKLLPMADIITPNIPEAEVLSGVKIKQESDMIKAAEKICSFYQGAVLIKGGHLLNNATDLLYTKNKTYWFTSEKIENNNTHGTGCTLSSAIACNLARGLAINESVKKSKDYLTGALKAMLDIGKGSGPLDHTYNI